MLTEKCKKEEYKLYFFSYKLNILLNDNYLSHFAAIPTIFSLS